MKNLKRNCLALLMVSALGMSSLLSPKALATNDSIPNSVGGGRS